MMAEEEAENSALSQFIKDMPQVTFNTYRSRDDMWVFWSKDHYIQSEEEEKEEEEEVEGCTVKDLIKSALYKVRYDTYCDDPDILIQFWGVKTRIGGRRFLTTRNQPFALRRIVRGGLCDYRIHCMTLEFNVNDDEQEEEFGGGVIGRVFRHKHRESTPNVGYYSTKDYPQREFALKCGIRRYLAVPVFRPSDQTCYGVLELVDTDNCDNVFPNDLHSAAKNLFKVEYLKIHLVTELQMEEGTDEVLGEINKALKVVCTTHQLPLAQIWIPCSAMAYVDSCYISYLGCTDTYSSFICQSADGDELLKLNSICRYNYLRKGQGIVGKALLSHKPCFCRDVSQLPIAEYPLSHYARKYGFSGCFAICLHCTSGTKNHDYVLEFFLPLLWNIISGDPQTFLESLLATVKKHLPGFEICSGEGPVEELRVEAEEAEKNNNYTPSQFLKDMLQLTTFNTNWTRYGMWVFWSEDDPHHYPQTEEGCTVEELIKSALEDFKSGTYDRAPNILIQFWAVKTRIGGRRFLTTRNQPFAIRRIERGLCDYRIHSMTLEFDVDADEREEKQEEFGGGGVIGRVFKHKLWESTPNVRYYSTKHYPLKCGIMKSLAASVFGASGSCYGVLELVDTVDCFQRHLFWAAKAIFTGGYLKTHLGLELQIEEGIDKVLKEINKALEVVCTTHRLPLAQIWIPCGPSSAMAHVDSSEKSYYNSYLCCTNTFSSICRSDDRCTMYLELFSLNSICSYHYLRKGQGIVGKALLSHKPYFCRDVSQLPIAEYPLSHYARVYGFTGSFAICLHGTCARNDDYVLEFFLTPWNAISRDLPAFFDSVFAILKNHLPGFEICSGEGLVEELRVQILEISMNDEQDSFKICQATGIQPIPDSIQNEREAVRNEITGEAVIDSGSNVSGVEQNGVAVTCLEKIVETSERENEIAKTPINDEIEVVQLSDEDSSVETTIKNESTVMVAEQDDRGASSLEEICRGETLEREHETTEIPLSCDDIKKQFGKTLDDASKILGVSRSTLKRECRKHGIKRWPFPKRRKVNHSPSNHKRVNESVRRGDEVAESSGRDHTRSDLPQPLPLPPKQAAAAAHTIPTTTLQDFVTIKAKYRNTFIRFQLSFSSRMAELVENVTKRLPLKNGNFSIKYEDDEGDRILIACDEDLQGCLSSWRPLPDKTAIRLFVNKGS